jgi:hypothetical protein
LAITTDILGLASVSSRVFAALRPRVAGLAPLTNTSVEPVFGIYVMAGGFHGRACLGRDEVNTNTRRFPMHPTSFTPSIGVTIGRQTRLYYAYITTAPAALDAPSTMTLHAATLADLADLACDELQFDSFKAKTDARLILVDSTELAWQRRRCREHKHLFVAADPVLVGLNSLQHWLWQRLGTPAAAAKNPNAPSPRVCSVIH